MPADAKGWTSLRRHLMGHTDETRQRFRDQVSVGVVLIMLLLNYGAPRRSFFSRGGGGGSGPLACRPAAALIFSFSHPHVRASLVVRVRARTAVAVAASDIVSQSLETYLTTSYRF